MKKILFVILTTILILSCQNEEQDVQVYNASNEVLDFKGITLKYVDGRIILVSLKDAEMLVEDLNQGKNSQVILWLNQLPKYTSAFQAFDNITEKTLEATKGNVSAFKSFLYLNREENGDISFEPLIDHPILQFLINDKGILQIGDDIYKFERDQAIKVPLSLLQNGFDDNKLKSFSEYEVVPIVREFDQTIQTRGADYPNCTTTYSVPGGSRRIKGNMGTYSFGGSTYFTVSTQHQRRGTFGWVNSDADLLEHEGSYNSFLNPFYYSSTYDDHIASTWGPLNLPQNVFATHRATDLGNSAECYTSKNY